MLCKNHNNMETNRYISKIKQLISPAILLDDAGGTKMIHFTFRSSKKAIWDRMESWDGHVTEYVLYSCYDWSPPIETVYQGEKRAVIWHQHTYTHTHSQCTTASHVQ